MIPNFFSTKEIQDHIEKISQDGDLKTALMLQHLLNQVESSNNTLKRALETLKSLVEEAKS